MAAPHSLFHKRHHVHGQDGFTLMEVLIALAIVAACLAGVLRVFSTWTASAQLSEDTAYATIVAETRLALVGVEPPLTQGEYDGREDDRFSWHITISPYQTNESISPQDILDPLYKVNVVISWQDANTTRNVTLFTLRRSKDA